MKNNSVIEIDLSVIKNNIDVLQSHLKPGVGQMAVVKAEAYGHGAVAVAQAIASKVAWFAVNDIYEAVVLRESGISNPILVFGVPLKAEAKLYREHKITATISAVDHFQHLQAGTEYHLNFDTGMSRLGFRAEQLDEVRRLKDEYTKLNCTGIYSHFATADERGSAKVQKQLQAFKNICGRFDSELLTHMCNTSGIIACPDAQFNLVRTGIGIYGFSPGKVSIPQLEPAISWRTQLVQVNPIKKMETVSYGANWTANGEGFIGIIPVGYSDGIPRGLSGNFEVTIDKKQYPVVGTVTMNYCLVDLGRNPIKVGAEVYLWNQQHNAQHWAKKMDTIPYEILTGIPSKIQRRHY